MKYLLIVSLILNCYLIYDISKLNDKITQQEATIKSFKEATSEATRKAEKAREESAEKIARARDRLTIEREKAKERAEIAASEIERLRALEGAFKDPESELFFINEMIDSSVQL